MTAPRDFHWHDAPGPDPDTGRAPLAPTPAADDVPALLAEADAWCADTTRALRSGLVADLAEALRRERARHLHMHQINRGCARWDGVPCHEPAGCDCLAGAAGVDADMRDSPPGDA